MQYIVVGKKMNAVKNRFEGRTCKQHLQTPRYNRIPDWYRVKAVNIMDTLPEDKTMSVMLYLALTSSEDNVLLVAALLNAKQATTFLLLLFALMPTDTSQQRY